ncbi:histone family protein [Candidatus Woesearchaeota archaeon]|nr:histone family protein [Candidatus Woesearchaeota archaeon]
MKKRVLSLNAMDKLMRQAGAPRVSDEATEALAELLEKNGLEISREAVKYAEHAGRKTVTAKDVRLAGGVP